MSQPRIVVLGGGFAGLFTALDLAGSGEVTLVSDDDHFLFTPMLYEYLSGEVEEWHIAPKYNELLNDTAHFVKDVVAGVDFASQTVSLASYPEPIPYDVVVLAVDAPFFLRAVADPEVDALVFAFRDGHADRHLRGLLLGIEGFDVGELEQLQAVETAL